MTETVFTKHMNRNSNTVSTVWLADGTQVSFSHRNTLNGWANALRRKGVNLSDVVNSCAGLPESDRV